MTPQTRVTIVGRPNVGKSTVFNRLIGRRKAIVDDTPGVTRDRLVQEVMLGEKAFLLEDTGGLVLDRRSRNVIEEKVREQTVRAVEGSSVLIMVVDGRAGVMPGDLSAAEVVRRSGKPAVLLVNKIDDPIRGADVSEFYSLGLGEPLPVSAEHDLGFETLRERLGRLVPAAPPSGEQAAAAVIILGRPNVGKSTLVNAILHEERLLTSEIPGTTRDSVDVAVVHDGDRYLFIDTAGIRRRSKVKEPLEFYSVRRAMGSLARADVAVVLIDGTEGLTVQDRKIIEVVVGKGKGIVLGVNKWDVAGKGTSRREFGRDLAESLGEFSWIPTVFLSALRETGLGELFGAVRKVRESLVRKVSTKRASDLLRQLSSRHALPGGARLTYGFQKDGTPPSFVVFVPRKLVVPDSYRRYLETSFREAFTLDGCPVTLHFKAEKR